LHRQQPKNDKRNVDFAPSGKISVDAYGCGDRRLNISFLVECLASGQQKRNCST